MGQVLTPKFTTMQKIKLRTVPNSVVMSDKDLKDIVGGIITHSHCTCFLHSSSGDMSGGGTIAMPTGGGHETCEYSCLEICYGTSGCTNITYEFGASGATYRNY